MSFFKTLARDIYGALRSASGTSSTVGGIGGGVGGAPTQSKFVGNDITPGDVNILAIKAIKLNSGVEHDMMSQVTEFHIFESIISPVIFAHMQIADAINLEEDFKFNVDDTYVYVEFQTPGTKFSIKHMFKVNSVSNKIDVPSNGMKTYALQLMSPEAATTAESIDKASQGDISEFELNTTPKNLIKKILDEHVETNPKIMSLKKSFRLPPKAQYLHDTKGIIVKNKLQLNQFPANKKAFQAIHQITTISNASVEDHVLHTFFLNRHGYHFSSIERLIKEGKKLFKLDQTDAIFIYDNLRNENVDGVKFRNIIAYNQINAGNAGEAAALGADSDIRVYNPQASTLTAAPKANQANAPSSTLVSNRDTTGKTRKDVVISSEMDYLHEVMEKRRSLLLRMSQFEAQIMIYGDTNLAVGDVIECVFPRSNSTETPTGGDNVSKDSGKYIITHLRHMVLNTGRPQHVISCNLMKAEPQRS